MSRATDQEVAWYAEEHGCSMLVARAELEQEAADTVPFCPVCGEQHEPGCGTDDFPEPAEMRDTGR